MNNNKSYVDIKVTFSHVVILLVAVILIGVFLFYLGFNAGKNENIGNKSFREISDSSVNSNELILNTKGKKIPDKVEPDIKKELDLFEKSVEKSKQKIIPVKKIKIQKNKTRDNYYSIQVGSFKSHLLAKDYAKKFTKIGYQTEISQFRFKSIIWFRVKVGNFKTFDIANQERIKLEKMEKRKFQTVKSN